MSKNKIYIADLETTTKEDDCRVYTVGVVELGNDDSFWYCDDLDTLFAVLCKENSTTYFHNLKFDGQFIIDWLYKMGYAYVHDKKQRSQYSFTTLIGEMGEFYSITIWFGGGDSRPYKMEILDSLKILPFKVEQMPLAFGMENIEKLGETYDYDKERPIGYTIDEEEEMYLRNDVLIVSKAIQFLFNEGHTKLTTASNSLADFKKLYSNSEFNALFPTPYYDSEVRASYKGGFTYLNPKYKSKEVKEVSVFDVNSLYPSVMYYNFLPYGEPIEFEGKYKKDKEYPLYIQKILCNFNLKKDKIPTIQIKGNKRFKSTEYLNDSQDDVVELTLTNVDLELFFEHYDVYDIKWLGGYMFKQSNIMFRTYIDKWSRVKADSTRIVKNGIVIQEGNEGMRTLSKLMLNSLYGKFAVNPKTNKKIPIYDKEVVRYIIEESEDRKPLYVPVSSFITSYARRITIEASQKIRNYSLEKYGEDKYIYSDTDSLHTLLTLEEISEFLDIDDTKLGAWDYEGSFKHGKYIRTKAYIQTNNKNSRYIEKPTKEQKKNKEGLFITCSGMPTGCYKEVTFENFKEGTEFGGKLQFKRVKGGAILKETKFTFSF